MAKQREELDLTEEEDAFRTRSIFKELLRQHLRSKISVKTSESEEIQNRRQAELSKQKV